MSDSLAMTSPAAPDTTSTVTGTPGCGVAVRFLSVASAMSGSPGSSSLGSSSRSAARPSPLATEKLVSADARVEPSTASTSRRAVYEPGGAAVGHESVSRHSPPGSTIGSGTSLSKEEAPPPSGSIEKRDTAPPRAALTLRLSMVASKPAESPSVTSGVRARSRAVTSSSGSTRKATSVSTLRLPSFATAASRNR